MSVRAFNFIGEGAVARTTVLTEEEAPGGPPISLEAKIVSARHVTLNWNPPEEPNGVLDYDVIIFDKGKCCSFIAIKFDS